MKKPLTPKQRALLKAVQTHPAPTIRNLMQKIGSNSTSHVAAMLEQLAARELIVLESNGHGLSVWRGDDYAQAWDSAARLAGNEVA